MVGKVYQRNNNQASQVIQKIILQRHHQNKYLNPYKSTVSDPQLLNKSAAELAEEALSINTRKNRMAHPMS